MSGVIRRGPDWLADPAVEELQAELGLDDVEVQLVGFRRSFAGKAWPHSGLIRMVSQGVHPLRWLTTYLHELAHILDWRERCRAMEAELGRPPRRVDGRAVWRLDRTHGELWRRQFVRIAELAVAKGLFPGNEQAVLDYAASGAKSSDQLWLDLAADPRVDAPELAAAEAQSRAMVEQLRAQTAEFRRAFRPGLEVHFDGGPRQGVLTGRLVRVNRQTCTVTAGSVNWRVPHAFLRLGPAPPDAVPAPRPPLPRERFTPGQSVTFRHDGARYRGRVLRLNRKTCTVDTPEHGQWRVTFGLLKPLDT